MGLQEDKIQGFFNFMNERHAVYLRRQRGDEWPWTDDIILQTYKFTNIYRELDIGTLWLRENIREPYANHPELFFNIAAYRRYNYWPTAEVIGFIEDYNSDTIKGIINRLNEYKAHGGHVFTGAHMLYCTRGIDKITHVFEVVLKELWNKRKEIEPTDADNLHSSYNHLLSIIGYGPFISYEVITDLRWTRYLDKANDIMTWANPGPGCKRGIQRLMGLQVDYVNGVAASREVKKHYPNVEGYLEIMKYLLDVSDGFLTYWMMPLEMRDIEHTLCEWDKYERVRLGQGRPRSKFVAPHLRKY